MQGFNAEHLQEKWAPILNHEGLGGIQDAHKRMVTAVLLENQERMLQEERAFLSEAPANTVSGGGYVGSGAESSGAQAAAGFDPVLISLIRRAMPNLVAYDLAGVQPMNGPTGLIFAMRSRYSSQTGTEALFDEADTGFSNSGIGTGGKYTPNSEGTAVGLGTVGLDTGSNPGLLSPSAQDGSVYSVGQGMSAAQSEELGAGQSFNEMAFSIEKVTVTAKSRALKAEYSLELAQDLKAIHGLNAEAELGKHSLN
jgi:hypothetical protein